MYAVNIISFYKCIKVYKQFIIYVLYHGINIIFTVAHTINMCYLFTLFAYNILLRSSNSVYHYPLLNNKNRIQMVQAIYQMVLSIFFVFISVRYYHVIDNVIINITLHIIQRSSYHNRYSNSKTLSVSRNLISFTCCVSWCY